MVDTVDIKSPNLMFQIFLVGRRASLKATNVNCNADYLIPNLKSTPFCGNLPENVKALKAQA
jgi:hypothetical protein